MRLSLAEGYTDAAFRHTDAAEKLIDATGYKRRLQDLVELRERLG